MAMTPEVSDLVNKIKTEQSANKMRGYIADGLKSTNEKAVNTDGRQDVLRSDFVSLGNQFKDVIDSTTDKDVISAPEIIAARSGEIDLNTRLTKNEQETTAQFQQNENHIKTDFVNINEFGGISDYLLPDGSLNPTPTDNSTAIENAFLVSNRVFGDGESYYFSRPIILPKSATLDLRGSTFWFANDGINVGNYVWNKPRVYGGIIEGIDKTGRGVFNTNGYVVYAHFDLEIRHFEKPFDLIASNENSNLTWSEVKLIIYECVYGVTLTGGWSNTVKIHELSYNYIEKEAFILSNCTQFHNLTIDKMVLENCATAEEQVSGFVLDGSFNGELKITDLYVENVGWTKKATPSEKTLYMTTGIKVIAKDGVSDTKSYRLADKIYSEDSNLIYYANEKNNGIFRINNGTRTTLLTIENIYLAGKIYPLIAFNNSNSNVKIDKIHLVTDGFSYNNVRDFFSNSTPLKKPKIKMIGVTNEGGGNKFTYGDVDLTGELFGGASIDNMESYAQFAQPLNQDIQTLATHTFIYGSKISGDLLVDTVSNVSEKIKFPSSGLYLFSLQFVLANNNAEGIELVVQTATNKIIETFKNLSGAQVVNFVGVLLVKEGETVSVSMKNNSSTKTTVVGSNNGRQNLVITKLK